MTPCLATLHLPTVPRPLCAGLFGLRGAEAGTVAPALPRGGKKPPAVPLPR